MLHVLGALSVQPFSGAFEKGLERVSSPVRPVRAKRPVKPMPGGSGSWLMQLEDGSYCVVKFRDNPQGSRVLINEWIGCRLAQRLGLPVAEPLHVLVDEGTCERWPQLRASHVQPGIHFGSRTPVDPTKTAVYGTFPPALLAKVSNLDCALRVWAFDSWIGNVDGRQIIFTRERKKALGAKGYRLTLIDYGFALGGPQWEPVEGAPPLCPCQRYALRNGLAGTMQEAIDHILELRYEDLLAVADEIPQEWFCSVEEETRLRQWVLVELENRRKRLRCLACSEWRSASCHDHPFRGRLTFSARNRRTDD